MCARVRVTVGVVEVAEPAVVAASLRRVSVRRHANVPLARHVRGEPGALELLSDARHVDWDAGKASDGVARIAHGRLDVLVVDVDREPPALEARAAGRAEFVDIMARELDTFGDKLVNVGRHDLRAAPVVTDVVPPKVVGDEGDDVRWLRHGGRVR